MSARCPKCDYYLTLDSDGGVECLVCTNAALKKERDTLDRIGRRMGERLSLLEKAIGFLWQIIDDIDTVDDMAKSNDSAYRRMVFRLQKKRWETGITTDGYKLDLSKLRDPSAKKEGE